MAVSITSARIALAVPEALSLSSAQLTAAYAKIFSLNVRTVVLTVPWNAVTTWTALDRAVNQAVTSRLAVRLVLTGPLPATETYPSPSGFAYFTGQVAKRYKNKATEFVIWDSPNTAASWGDAPSAADYVALLKSAYGAVKGASSANKVIFGNLEAVIPVESRLSPTRQARLKRLQAATPVSSEVNPKDFLTAAYAAGAKGFFDILGYNPLSRATAQKPKPPAPSGDSIKQSDDLKGVMVAKGDRLKPIYWTVGYDTDAFTTLQQSLYLDTLRWLAEGRKDHVTSLTVHALRDLS